MTCGINSKWNIVKFKCTNIFAIIGYYKILEA